MALRSRDSYARRRSNSKSLKEKRSSRSKRSLSDTEVDTDGETLSCDERLKKTPTDEIEDFEQMLEQVNAYETIQLVSALMIGVGLHIWSELETTVDKHNEVSYYHKEVIHHLTWIVVTMNLFGLVILTIQMFYLRQCIVKAPQYFDEYRKDKTIKEIRYYANQCVIWSMPLVAIDWGLIAAVRSPIVGVIHSLTGLFAIGIILYIKKAFKKLRALSK